MILSEVGRYVQILCRTCGIKALVISGRPWPKRCIRCGAKFDLKSRTFEDRSEQPVVSAQP